MNLLSTCAIGVGAAALLAGCAQRVDNAKIADEIKADADQIVTGFNAHDAAKTVVFDAPDMVGMFHGLPNTIGPDQDLASTKQQLTDPAAKLAVSNETVDVAASGDMAVLRARYDFTATDPKTKQPSTEHGNWIAGWRKQPDGGWKMAWSVISDVGAPPAATPAAPPSP